MNDIRAMFTLAPMPYEFRGAQLSLRRPSALDIIEAVEFSKAHQDRLYAWFAFRHLEHAGKPVFESLEDALAADGATIIEIGKQVETLYGEGRD